MAHVLEANTVEPASQAVRRGGTAIRNLDPRTRILAALAFAIVMVGLDGFIALGAGLALSLTAMVLSRLPAAPTLRRMAAMDGFIIFMIAMLPFTVPGDPMFSLLGFQASWQGLYKALQIALTANAIVLMLMTLVGTMEAVTLGHALHRLKMPAVLVHLLLFTVRYIEVLRQEYSKLRRSMKTRGFQARNSLHTYRSFGYLIGMMLVRALERSERILQAMKCRGFRGQFPMLQALCFSRRDLQFAILAAAALAALIILEVSHVGTH